MAKIQEEIFYSAELEFDGNDEVDDAISFFTMIMPPAEATIVDITVSGTVNISVTRGSEGHVTINNDVTFTGLKNIPVSYDFETSLGKYYSEINSVPVTLKSVILGKGTVTFSNLYYNIYYKIEGEVTLKTFYIGTSEIASLYVGDKEVSEVFLGDILVYGEE